MVSETRGANWGVEHLDVVECITLSLVVKICRLVRSPLSTEMLRRFPLMSCD